MYSPIQIHPNEDNKVFNKHQVRDHLATLLISTVSRKKILKENLIGQKLNATVGQKSTEFRLFPYLC